MIKKFLSSCSFQERKLANCWLQVDQPFAKVDDRRPRVLTIETILVSTGVAGVLGNQQVKGKVNRRSRCRYMSEGEVTQ